MRFIKKYLRDRIRGIIVWAISMAVVGATYYLFNLPWEAIRYVFILNTFFYLVFMAFDLYRYVEKKQQLKQLTNAIAFRSNFIEPVGNSIESDYMDMLNILIDAKNRLTTQYDRGHTEMLDYYSMWVHQIKTPIAALDLMIQTTQDANKSSMAVELFKVEQYVNMALNYLRLDSEDSDFVFKPVDVEMCVKQVVKKYRRIFIEKKLGIVLHIEEGSKIVTDEKWLVFALEQVLSNALKYTSEGDITISYAKGQLIIEDTGCGIQPEDLPRVFEKGFTGYNGRLNTKATGIGLYLTKRILEKLSLNVDVQSEVGKGTKVIILTSL